MSLNKLNRLLGTRIPIVSGPMAGASGGALAAAVTLGGGFGFFGAGYMSSEKLKSELSLARSMLEVDAANQLPIGVGFLCWRLEMPNSAELELLSITLESNVKAVWFAFGSEIGRWVNVVRDHDRKTGNTTAIFVLVSSVEEAVLAFQRWKPDVIVAQGIEAGGHGHSLAPPLSTLIPAIVEALPNNEAPPLIGAGGVSEGAHVASILTLGASGVCVGTRFLLSPESWYSDKQKQALINAKSTVRTMAFDLVRGTVGWPMGVDGRCLYNNTVQDFDSGVNLEEVKEKYSTDDPDRMLVWAGTGVALMTVIKPAKDIVGELHQNCLKHLERAMLSVSQT